MLSTAPPGGPRAARTPTAKPDARDPPKPDASKAAAAGAPAFPPATIVFSVQPWGEIFINGKSAGVTQPMKSLKLAPGKYRIEVRNTTFAAYAETLDVKSRDEITVRHRFQ